MTKIKPRGKAVRPAALLVSASLVVPPLLAGCGGAPDQTASAPPPPGMENPRMNAPRANAPRNAPAARPRQGMSTGQKVAILAGAAALYYIYNKRKNKAASAKGPEGKYFISESTGRVYYRNLKDGSFQWVSPPRRPIRVPVEEARQYQNYAGYNNRNSGRGFGGYGPDSSRTYNDAEPAVWN
jgi:hypothetical protein